MQTDLGPEELEMTTDFGMKFSLVFSDRCLSPREWACFLIVRDLHRLLRSSREVICRRVHQCTCCLHSLFELINKSKLNQRARQQSALSTSKRRVINHWPAEPLRSKLSFLQLLDCNFLIGRLIVQTNQGLIQVTTNDNDSIVFLWHHIYTLPLMWLA